ncbi:MAG: helix-turn-helix transcriptional regulator [Gemmatimonadales bacterium]|nr:helix-turn-helix transcriptional regulator [Gemmatimonadales bacterium]
MSSIGRACLILIPVRARLRIGNAIDEDVHVHPTSEGFSVKPTLGEYLASIRRDRKMTLRDVEEATEKGVSNAYLSQIEHNKIRKPSPNVLHSLAEIYAISFENLMIKAGYLMPSSERAADDRHGRVATFAEHNLTEEEESELLRFLQFIRSKGRTHDTT